MTNHEKYLLLIFQELLGKVRPFSTKKLTHLCKSTSAEEGLAVTYFTFNICDNRNPDVSILNP